MQVRMSALGALVRRVALPAVEAPAVVEGTCSRTTTTRQLCVAAHVDERFAQQVLHVLLDRRYQVVAPCPGVDLPTVVRYCLAARNRRTVRDLLIVGTIVLGFWLLGPTVLLLCAAVVALALLGTVSVGRSRALPIPALMVLAWLWLLLWPGLVLATSAAASFIGGLSGDGPGVEPTGGLGRILLLVLPYLLVGYVVADVLATRHVLVTRLRAGGFDPARGSTQDAWIQERLQALAEGQRTADNVTIYSGFSPFVGAGLPAKAWSFAVDLSRPRKDPRELGELVGPGVELGDPGTAARMGRGRAREAAADETAGPERIDVEDLYAAVERQVRAKLAVDGDRPPRRPKLQTQRRVFVDGALISDDARFLPDPNRPPRTALESAEIDAIAHDATGPARHYLLFQIGSWDEEVIRSVYLHLAVTGRTLYVELVKTILLPLSDTYRVADEIPRRLTVSGLARLVTQAVLRAPTFIMTAPFGLASTVAAPFRRAAHERRHDQSVRLGTPFDYGASQSVREAASADAYDNYFQQLDADQHLKLLQTHILESINDHLRARGIDTGARQEQAILLNQGLIMTGQSSVTGSTIAAGPSASVSLTNLGPAMA